MELAKNVGDPINNSYTKFRVKMLNHSEEMIYNELKTKLLQSVDTYPPN